MFFAECVCRSKCQLMTTYNPLLFLSETSTRYVFIEIHVTEDSSPPPTLRDAHRRCRSVVGRGPTMSAGRSVALLLLALLLALVVTDCWARRRGLCHDIAEQRREDVERSSKEDTEWFESGCRRVRCSRGRLQVDECPPLPDVLPPGCRRRDVHASHYYPACCPAFDCRPPSDRPCYAPELERHVAIGETWTLPGCAQATCRSAGGSVTIEGCSPTTVLPGSHCTLQDRDESLEYPQCCPRVTCPECYSKKTGRFFGPGDSWTGPGCIKETCLVSIYTPVQSSPVQSRYSSTQQ